MTDAFGRFSPLLLARGALTMVVEKEGFLTQELSHLPRAGEPLEICLQTGRAVWVAVVDESGGPVSGGEVFLRPRGQDSWADARREGPGRFEASGLPDGAYEFELRLAGKRWLREHDTSVPELVFQVERPCEVEVHWVVQTSEPWLRWLDLRLEPRATDRAAVDMDNSTAATTGVEHFRAVLPGDYEAVLLLRRDETSSELARQPVTVRAGEAAQVELRASWP